ncbi:MAG: hypothetical protein HFE63_00235 [Clostridiales bacterium]|nr:hypothetical protein [Clostridiales bacterium]
MNKLRLFGIINMTAVVVLELLPYGAVCIFMPDPSLKMRETYSYFNPVPFGYANFGPLITALLSCVLLVMWIYGAVFESEIYHFRGLAVITAMALFASLSPLFIDGLRYYSIVGAFISLLLLCALVLSIIGVRFFSK